MIWRRFNDSLSTTVIRGSLIVVNLIALIIGATLFFKAKPILANNSFIHLIFSSTWHPLKGQFGFFPFIAGSVMVTVVAMVLSIPVCLLSAIYLSEYAKRRFREVARLMVDMLAGIPSVIYGLFGVIVVVPLVSIMGGALGIMTTGYSLLAGGVILAIMVAPFIISVSTEVLMATPAEARENAIALGATRWETVKYVILKNAKQGIIAAVVLGFARAFGETIAVMMVVGNVIKVPRSLFDPAYPLPALIANNYGEMMSIPFYDSALMFGSLILMLVVGCFSIAAHLALVRIEKQSI